MRRTDLLSLTSLLVPAAALATLAASAPGAGPYRDVADHLRTAARPGDLVVVTPAWALDRLRHFAGLGLGVVAATDASAALRAGFPRVWVVTPPGTPARPPPPAAAAARLVETRELSGLRLDLFATGP